MEKLHVCLFCDTSSERITNLQLVQVINWMNGVGKLLRACTPSALNYSFVCTACLSHSLISKICTMSCVLWWSFCILNPWWSPTLYLLPSTDDSEFPPPAQLPYIKRRTSSIFAKWAKLQKLLKEREQPLEMSSGSMQDYLERFQNLLDWIDQELQRDALVVVPPARAQLIKGYLGQIQVKRCLTSKGY